MGGGAVAKIKSILRDNNSLMSNTVQQTYTLAFSLLA